jgi:putative sterol carrier protein
MPERARPPDDITPDEFFTAWLPRTVAEDGARREKLGDTDAVLVFELAGAGGGTFTLHIYDGRVRGVAGDSAKADLRICLDVDTWRSLNRGELSAPEAALRRRVKLSGNLLLAVKLHLIVG